MAIEMTPAVQKALACAKAMATPALRSAGKALCSGVPVNSPALLAVDSHAGEARGLAIVILICLALFGVIVLLRWLHKRGKIKLDDDYGETSGPILNPASGGMMLDPDGLDVYGNMYGVSSIIFDDDD